MTETGTIVTEGWDQAVPVLAVKADDLDALLQRLEARERRFAEAQGFKAAVGPLRPHSRCRGECRPRALRPRLGGRGRGGAAPRRQAHGAAGRERTGWRKASRIPSFRRSPSRSAAIVSIAIASRRTVSPGLPSAKAPTFPRSPASGTGSSSPATSSTRRPTTSRRTILPARREALAARFGASVSVLDGEALAQGFPMVQAVGARQRPAAVLHRYPLGQRERPQGDAGRQGHRVRHRRPRHQALERHGADEEGHGRGGECPGPRLHDHGFRAEAAAPGAHTGGGERHFRPLLPPRRRARRAARG